MENNKEQKYYAAVHVRNGGINYCIAVGCSRHEALANAHDFATKHRALGNVLFYEDGVHKYPIIKMDRHGGGAYVGWLIPEGVYVVECSCQLYEERGGCDFAISCLLVPVNGGYNAILWKDAGND